MQIRTEQDSSEFVEITLVTDVPLEQLLTPITECTFGHTGAKVQACDRDALEGTDYCAVHLDRH